jgi:hypothetical protein
MSHDLAIQSLTAVRTNAEIVGEVRAATSQPPPQPQQAATPSPIANPSLRLDPALGIVVLEFRNDAGAVTTSIPSQRQLQAYQKWETTRLGPAPAGKAPSEVVAGQAPDRPAVQIQTSATPKP